MNEYTTTAGHLQFSSAVSLAGVGLYLRTEGMFEPVRQRVHIAQKTIKYTPIEKLAMAFGAILAGARGLVQTNTLLRPDPALQTGLGLPGCAEQSVIQDT